MGEVGETVRALGGWAAWRELRAVHPRRAIERARRVGEVERVARGQYTLPSTGEHLRRARASTATLSHLSAALHHGWKVKTPPQDAHVTVRARRHLRRPPDGLVVHWSDLGPDDVDHGVTTPLRTVLDCARSLAFDEALAVADSALRAGVVAPDALRAAAARSRGRGAAGIRRVAAHADGRAANPFESVLRALAVGEGLRLVPQLVVTGDGLFAVVDLGSEELRLAVEADGFETHGTRRGLRKDCRRHTELAVNGWSSLRFSYEDVMHEQPWTRWALRSWRERHEGLQPAAPPLRRPQAA